MRIRASLSGSRVHRVWKCPPSLILPQIETIDEPSPAAERGKVIHAFLERVRTLGVEASIAEAIVGMSEDEAARIGWLMRAIDVENLPTHLATEVAFLYDWKARTAREIGRGIGRDYAGHLYRTKQAPQGPTEIPLTIDLVGAQDVNGRRMGYVGDYKSGHTKYPAPDRFGQTLLAGLCVRHVYRCEILVLELLYIRASGESGIARRVVDEWDLDTFADELEAAMELADYAEAEYVAGRGVPAREGPHCEYCPAYKQCPAKVALVKSIPAELAALGITRAVLADNEPPVPGTAAAGAGAMSRERMAEVWMVMEAIEGVFSRIKQEICDASISEETPLPDGRVIGLVSSERENLVGKTARTVLEAMFGTEAERLGVDLDEAVTIKVSKDAAASVIGKIVKARAPEREAAGEKREVMQSKNGTGTVDRFFSEVRRRNGIELSTSVSSKPHVPRKRLKS